MCEEIDLSDNFIEGSGAAALAEMLKDNMFVVNLVSFDWLHSIITAFCNCAHWALWSIISEFHITISLQNISNNFIRTEGAGAFAEMLEANTTLKTLVLRGMFLIWYLKNAFVFVTHVKVNS